MGGEVDATAGPGVDAQGATRPSECAVSNCATGACTAAARGVDLLGTRAGQPTLRIVDPLAGRPREPVAQPRSPREPRRHLETPLQPSGSDPLGSFPFPQRNSVEVTICYHERLRHHRTCGVHRAGQLEIPFESTRSQFDSSPNDIRGSQGSDIASGMPSPRGDCGLNEQGDHHAHPM
jgi:hypothetical protein